MNVHHYSNDAGGQGGEPTTGISPESDGLRDRIAKLRDFCDRYVPGRELWISEFGYDTNPASNQRAPAIGSFSAEEVQAQWIVRSYLAICAGGADRAHQFMLRDVNSTSGGRFQTCGLVSSKETGWRPKRSWYYVYTLRNALSGLRFHDEQPSGNPDVRVYRFWDERRSIRAWVVWCPTANETAVADYQLQLAPGVASADVITFVANSTQGTRRPLNLQSGRVAIVVSERPVIVLAEYARVK
jgi:hypothetical protein